MKIPFVALASAALLAAGVAVEAQQLRPAQAPPAGTVTPGGPTVHIEGCVFPKAAQGAAQGAATRAGAPAAAADSFMLTDTKAIALAPGTNIPDGGTIALTQADKARLEHLSGKRAEVTGRLQSEGDAPQLQITSIVETVGSCPAKPDAKPGAHS
jgi:hypothetical protein